MKFNWFKQKACKQDLLPQKTALEKQLHALKNLTDVTQPDFERLYLKTIERFSEYVQSPNQGMDTITIERSLNQAMEALKKRQGYLLPIGAESEVAFREREVWSYAIFSAALFKALPKAHRTCLAKALLPAQGFAWLHRYKALFELWQTYLQGHAQQEDIFTQIIGNTQSLDEVEPIQLEADSTKNAQTEEFIKSKPSTEISKRVEVPEETPTESPAAIAVTRLEEKQSLIEKPKTKIPKLSAGAVIQEIDLADLKAAPKEVMPASQKTSTKPELEPTKTNDSPKITVEAFWDFLKQGIVHQTLSINETESVVHGIAIDNAKTGILIGIPGAISAFFESLAKEQHTTHTTPKYDQRIALTKALKKQNILIRNAQGARIHSYCLGKWEDRHVISGVVIPAKHLVDEAQTFSINTRLTKDPLETI